MDLFTVTEIALSVFLVIAILVQHRASGLSATFGGSGTVALQRRGAEKFLYRLTIWLSVLFFGLAVAQWYVGY